MKFKIDNLHREYFDEEGLVEFEQLLSESELEPVLAELGSRLNRSTAHDLWRENAVVKKLVFSSRLAQIASELTDERPLRLAFDHLFTNKSHEGFDQPLSLKEISSFQGLACGLIFRLSGESEEETTLAPKSAGSGVYISPDHPCDFTELTKEEGLFLLIAYTEARSVFVVCPTDPYVKEARALGYMVGDRLDEKRNPTVYR